MAEPPVIAEGLFSFQIGGSERVGADLAIEFHRRGYRVLSFAFYDSDGPIRAELEARGIACVDLNYTTRHRLTRRLTYQLEFRRFLRREKVRALHVHHATALILCGLPARLAGVPRVVMTEHALHQLQERPAYRQSSRRYCRTAHAITAVHPGIADYFHDELAVPRERLHFVPNGVRMPQKDTAAYHRLRATLGVPPDCFLFVFVGRLHPAKDLSTLLRATAALPPSARAQTRVILIGDGAERARLETECRSLGLTGTLEFLGARTDATTLLGAADGFIMTSITEGLPMALLEAMAAGLPCISTAVGGIPELLADGAGLLAPSGDPAAIAQAMITLMRDAPLRLQLGGQARRKVAASNDLDQVATAYLALLGLPPRWPVAQA